MLPISLLRPHLLGEPSPASPYKFPFGTKSEEIEKELLIKASFYKDIQWSEVELSVNKNNLEVNKNIAKIDAGMQTLYSQLRKLRLAANLKQIEMNLLALTCIADAERKITASMKQLEQEKLAEKEKELIAQIFDVSGQGGDPSKSIASETYQKVQTLNNSNTTVKSFLQELVIENGVVKSYGSAASSDMFRTVQHFWMYPMTTNQNGYKVGVVLRFKMGNVRTSPQNDGVTNPSFTSNRCDFAEMIDMDGGRNFAIGKYEVTQKQWKQIMGENPSYFKGDNLPVESVSWNEVQVFLQKLNAKYPNCNYRLPTEAEWEYAAKGGYRGKGYTYSGSNTIGDVAWYAHNSGSKTHTVGGKNPNELGIYDMSGNVWEWCEDIYNDSDRELRGGSWFYVRPHCGSAYRGSSSPDGSDGNVGFRLCWTK